jgi:hypothetical protein
MHWWQPILTGLAGAALTLGLMLWFAARDARPGVQPEVKVPGRTTVRLGTDAAGFSDADVVFPLERYVLDGEVQWLPLLLQLDDPEWLEGDKMACVSLLDAMPENSACPVEYSIWLDPRQAGRVLGVEALVFADESSPCRAYVECRLPGLASVRLDVPQGVFDAHPSGLRITDRANHAARRPGVEDEEREISELLALLARPDPPELLSMPLEAQRWQQFFRLRRKQRLEALQRRKQRR